MEPWQKFASREDLLNAYALSKPVAGIVKLVLWHTTISQLDGTLRDQYKSIIPSLWQEFLMFEKMIAK